MNQKEHKVTCHHRTSHIHDNKDFKCRCICTCFVKDPCRTLIHASEGQYCANEKPCGVHESGEKGETKLSPSLKEECGFGCGRVWDEPGDFDDCVSGYHIARKEKSEIPILSGENWEETFEKEFKYKITSHEFDGSCCYNNNEGGKGHPECRYPYNPGRENPKGNQCLKLEEEHFNFKSFISSLLQEERARVERVVIEATPSHITREYRDTDKMRDDILLALRRK